MHTIVYTVDEGRCATGVVRGPAKEGTLGTHGVGMRVHEARIIGEHPRAKQAALGVRVAAGCLISLSSVACSQHAAPSRDGSWDPRAAAAYLDRRMEWWS